MIRTLIQWCYYTFGWFGCTKVSPGCKNCYMFALAKRYHDSRNVGPGAPRVLPKYFRAAIASMAAGKRRGAPFTWDRQCEKLGIRRGVFPSLCDPFDDEVPLEWFASLMALCHATQNLDWLLLTKRPENWRSRVEAACTFFGERGAAGDDNATAVFMMLDEWLSGHVAPPRNIWIGASVENQEYADRRIPWLLKIPARVRFLSCEPLLGAVEFSNGTNRSDCVSQLGKPALAGIHWVIAGGESGNECRPSNIDHVLGVVRQCRAVGVPVFVKQLGSRPFSFAEPTGIHCHKSQNMDVPPRWEWHLHLKHKKGGEMPEWPEDLRVRQLPEVRA